MARNLHLPDLLTATDQRRFAYYDRLSDAAKKEFVYSIVMRWANSISGPQAEEYLIKYNKRVNLYGDLLWKHPDLAFALMASCGSGRTLKHQYTKPVKKTVEDTTLIDFLALYWPGINQDEADLLLSQMDKKSFTELLQGSGRSPDDEKKIAAAYGKRESKK